MGKPKPYRTFIIEWKHENLAKGIEKSELEEHKVRRLKNSDAEVQLALLYILSKYKSNTQPRWQGYFVANHAFIWDKPRAYMYCHVGLEDFTEFGVRADRIEI